MQPQLPNEPQALEALLVANLIEQIEKDQKDGLQHNSSRFTRELGEQLERHVNNANDRWETFPLLKTILSAEKFSFNEDAFTFGVEIEDPTLLLDQLNYIQDIYKVFSAAKRGDVNQVKAVVSKFPATLAGSGPGGETLLYVAARNAQLAVVRLLVEDFKCDVNVRNNSNGATPLHAAGFGNNNVLVARYLLEHGADEGAETLVSKSKPHVPHGARPVMPQLPVVAAAKIDPALVKQYQEMMDKRARVAQDGTLDVCIVMDCTSSMKDYLKELKDKLCKLADDIKAHMQGRRFRMAFVGYRDFNHPKAEQIEAMDFTTDIVELQEFLNSVEAKKAPNSDFAEDVHGGLEHASKLKWQANYRVIILTGDAPCHGMQTPIRDANAVYDSYPDFDPQNTKAEAVLRALQKQSIDLHFFKLDEYTNAMEATWSHLYNNWDLERRWCTHTRSAKATDVIGSFFDVVSLSSFGRRARVVRP